MAVAPPGRSLIDQVRAVYAEYSKYPSVDLSTEQDHRDVSDLEDPERLAQEAVPHDGHEYRPRRVDGVDVAHRDGSGVGIRK